MYHLSTLTPSGVLAGPPIFSRNLIRLCSFVAAIGIFVYVSAPSLKIVFPGGELINIVPLFLLLPLALLMLFVRSIGVNRIVVMSIYLFFFSVLMSTYFISMSGVSVASGLSYLIFAVFTATAVMAYNSVVQRDAALMLLGWGALVAYLQLGGLLVLGPSQHYGTVGVPIAIGVLVLFSLLMQGRPHWLITLALIALVGLPSFLALASLFGRGPLIFPVLVIGAYLLLVAVSSFSLKNILLALGGFTAIGVVGVTLVRAYVNPAVVERALRALTDFRNEPRYNDLYLPALQAIRESSFGYGLESARGLIGQYPHNIFLEIGITAGLWGIGLFLLLVLFYGFALVGLLLNRSIGWHALAVCLVSAFLFLVWNVSYDLGSAYGLLLMMALVKVLYFDGYYVGTGPRWARFGAAPG